MKILKSLLIFIVIISWLFNYPPSLYKNLGGLRIWPLGELGVNKICIPPEVKEAQAATLTLLPNAEGTVSTFTYVGGSLNYTNLQTNDEDTTYAYLPTGQNQNHTVNLDDTSLSGTINSVTAYVVGRAPGTTDDHEIMIYIGATAYNSGTEFGPPITYTTYSWVMTTSPATLVAWTWAEVNSLQVGIETDVYSGEVYYTQMYAVVDYTPAAAGPAVTAPASVSMSSYQLGGAGYNEYTFAAGELVAVVNAGSSGWSLTVSSTNMTGTKNTITNANILLRTDGTLATEPTIITSSDSLTGVTETTSGNYSLDSTRTIVSASAGNGIGTYNTRPTIRVNINNYGTYAETDTATLTFTVQ